MRHRMPPGQVRSTHGDTAATPSTARVGRTPEAPRPGHRYDVEGLRAVAILLVAGFHVWGGGRVSGGVDVFLLISGFFVGGGLLRRVGGGATFAYGAYVARLGRRLVPPLLLALAAVVVGTWLWLPRSEWSDVSGGVLASAAYVENWRMAIAGQAYAAADPMSSPVQHIWSLSVQGQLFVLLPLLLLAIRSVLRRSGLGAETARRGLVAAVAVLAAASFVWAIVGVQTNQNVAYFDTGARAWEYLAGTLVAAAASAVRLPRGVAVALGWIGLAMILATGLAVDARATFPGPAALLPIGGAVLVIVAGLGAGGAREPGVGRVLGWRPLATSGGYAYEFYLWHWVVLVLALAATGRESFGWLAGSVVLVVSGVAAWLARRVTDAALQARSGRADTHRDPPRATTPHRRAVTAVIAAGVVLTVALPAGWLAHRATDPWTGVVDLDVEANPGAPARLDPVRWPGDDTSPLVPSPLEAAQDWPLGGRENCGQSGQEDPEVRLCVLGNPESERSVALIGGSHSANFALALEVVALDADLRIDAYIKQGCPLLLREERETDDASEASCTSWNRAVMDAVVESGVVGVLTTGTRPGFEQPEADDGDYVPGDYVRAWRHLIDAGVPVVAIRDTPWFAEDVRGCVEVNGRDSEACRGDRHELLGRDVLTGALDDEAFTAVDLSDSFCDETYCYPVSGNVLAYIDSNHITATYQRTMGPAMADALVAVPWW